MARVWEQQIVDQDGVATMLNTLETSGAQIDGWAPLGDGSEVLIVAYREAKPVTPVGEVKPGHRQVARKPA